MCPVNSNNNTCNSDLTKVRIPLYFNMSDEELGKLFWGKVKRSSSGCAEMYANETDLCYPKNLLSAAMLEIELKRCDQAQTFLEQILKNKDAKAETPLVYDYARFLKRLYDLEVRMMMMSSLLNLLHTAKFSAMYKEGTSEISGLYKTSSRVPELKAEDIKKTVLTLILDHIALFEDFELYLSMDGQKAILDDICKVQVIFSQISKFCERIDRKSERNSFIIQCSVWDELEYMSELFKGGLVAPKVVNLLCKHILPELKVIITTEISGSAKKEFEIHRGQKFQLLTSYTAYNKSIFSLKSICELCKNINKLKLNSKGEIRAFFGLLSQIGELLHNKNLQLGIKLKYLAGARVLKKIRNAIIDVSDRGETIECLVDRVAGKEGLEPRLNPEERKNIIRELQDFVRQAEAALIELERVNFEDEKQIRELYLKMDGGLKKQLQDELKEILSGITEDKKKEIIEIVIGGIYYDMGVFPTGTGMRQEIVVFSEESRKKLNICMGGLDEPIQMAITEKVASKLEEKNQAIKDHNNCKSGKRPNLERLLKIAEIGRSKKYNPSKFEGIEAGMWQEMRVLKEILRGLNPEAFDFLQRVDPIKLGGEEGMICMDAVMIDGIEGNRKRAEAYVRDKRYRKLAKYVFKNRPEFELDRYAQSLGGRVLTADNCFLVANSPTTTGYDKGYLFSGLLDVDTEKQVDFALSDIGKQLEELEILVDLTKLTKAAKANPIILAGLEYSLSTLIRYVRDFDSKKNEQGGQGPLRRSSALRYTSIMHRNIMCHGIYNGTPDKAKSNITYYTIAIAAEVVTTLDKYLAGSKSQAPSNNNNSMEAASDNSLPSTALSEHRAASTAYVGRGPN